MDSNKKKQTKTKIIISVIIIIIIIILSISGYTSNFFGKIGNVFKSSSSYNIDETTGTKKIIENKNLVFEELEGTVSLDTDTYKIGYSVSKIKNADITCQTSDAEIATCVAMDDYVEVYPKSEGSVVIYIETSANGKTYRANHNLTITKATKSITLSNTKANIYLSESNELNIGYYLNNIDGDVKVSISDESVATATAKDGKLSITALKTGKTNITLSVNYNKKTYSRTLKLYVANVRPTTTTKAKKTTTTTSSKKKTTTGSKTSKKSTTTTTTNTQSTSKQTTQSTTKETTKQSTTEATTKETTKPTTEPTTSAKSKNNNLKSLSIENYSLDQTFASSTTSYTSKVNYNTTNVKVVAEKEDSKSTITYVYNNQTVSSVDSLTLNEGENTLKISVTSESGSTKVYTLTITRPSRTVKFDKTSIDSYIESIPLSVMYNILEDTIETEDYNLSDVTLTISDNYAGTSAIDKDIVTLTPNASDVGKTITLTITYNGKSSSVNINLTKKDYYLKVNSTNYDVTMIDGIGTRNIVFNTNILGSTVEESNIANGFMLSSTVTSQINSNSTVKITSSDPTIASVSYNTNEPGTYYTFKVNAHKSGTVTLTIESSIFGTPLDTKTITINVKAQYNVVLDANGGEFNEFSNKEEYVLEEGEVIKLSDYSPYKADTTGNCMYYDLVSYNTAADGTGTTYSTTDIITVNKSLTLYAIYSSTSAYEEKSSSKTIYLTDVNLFKNDEYYEKYNIEKIIYPGSTGYHDMEITNTSSSTITLKAVNLQEETICISEGCINMGYIVRYSTNKDGYTSYTHLFGSDNTYEILNKNANTTTLASSHTGYTKKLNTMNITDGIKLEPNEKVIITLNWKWVDTDNALDSKIGSTVGSLATLDSEGNNYALQVSIDYDTVNTYCTLS